MQRTNISKTFWCGVLAGLFVLSGLLFIPVDASSASHILATPKTLPGADPSHKGEVFLYKFEDTKGQDPKPLVALDPIPASFTNDPACTAFSSSGELFVSNREGNVGNGHGSISRFILDMDGNFFPNGTITGNGLETVVGLAFSPWGELFAANYYDNTVSRFTFDAAGNAVSNGTFSNGLLHTTHGLAFSPDGELFVTDSARYYPTVKRFVFDSGGAIINTSSFSVSGGSGLTGLAFSSDGELFIASAYNDKVFRYTFDANGTPEYKGSIQAPGGPLGVAFSSSGELFVTCHLDASGTIRRFLFDELGNAEENGTETVGVNLGGVAVYEPNMCSF